MEVKGITLVEFLDAIDQPEINSGGPIPRDTKDLMMAFFNKGIIVDGKWYAGITKDDLEAAFNSVNDAVEDFEFGELASPVIVSLLSF